MKSLTLFDVLVLSVALANDKIKKLFDDLWGLFTVGAAQLTNQANSYLAATANEQWDVATAGAYKFLLVGSTYTPSDAHTTVSDLGTGGTQAQVGADTAGWINAGDGASINVPSRSVINSSGAAQFRGGNASFGNPITITAVKYLACVHVANGTSVQTTDSLMWTMNLRTEDAAEVSASASEFTVQAPDVGGQTVWHRINAQA